MARPILANSSARATSAAEARFRITVPIVPARATRVIALDDGAVPIVDRVSKEPWSSARFFTGVNSGTELNGAERNGTEASDATLIATDGSRATLSEQLVGVDVAMMVATVAYGSGLAGTIGRACASRGIMTAGLVLGDWQQTAPVVAALRPYARVLLITRDESDVAALLDALRA